MQTPSVPGYSISGTIDSVGSLVSDFAVGDEVACVAPLTNPHGGLAEYTVQRATLVGMYNKRRARWCLWRKWPLFCSGSDDIAVCASTNVLPLPLPLFCSHSSTNIISSFSEKTRSLVV